MVLIPCKDVFQGLYEVLKTAQAANSDCESFVSASLNHYRIWIIYIYIIYMDSIAHLFRQKHISMGSVSGWYGQRNDSRKELSFPVVTC